MNADDTLERFVEIANAALTGARQGVTDCGV
jgi:hypothetical protein